MFAEEGCVGSGPVSRRQALAILGSSAPAVPPLRL